MSDPTLPPASVPPSAASLLPATSNPTSASTAIPSSSTSSSSGSNNGNSTSKHGLIFYFDVNGTVTPVDSVDTESPEQLINLFLSKNVYGHVTPSGRWQLNLESRVGKSLPDTITYTHFTKSRRLGKGAAFKFTEENEPGSDLAHLVPLLQTYYASHSSSAPSTAASSSSSSSSSSSASASATTPASGDSSQLRVPLFPSFLHVLHHYPHAKICFRTFGVDARSIIAEVQRELREAQLPPRTFVGYELLRTQEEKFALKPVNGGDAAVTGTAQQLGEFIDAHPTDLYVIDDYEYWNSRRRLAEHGKPIFPSPKGHTLIAFDDNACMELPDVTLHKGKAHFHHVDPIAALEDKLYFVNEIERILAESEQQ